MNLFPFLLFPFFFTNHIESTKVETKYNHHDEDDEDGDDDIVEEISLECE